jgi:hypothetical protein
VTVEPSRNTPQDIPATATLSVGQDVPASAAPAPPILAAIPVVEAKNEAPGSRVTGEMQVASSGKARTQSRMGTTSKFQIDPSLTLHVQPKPEPPRKNTPSHPQTQGVHRPSGSFSAIESDFFEREADLYKVEKTESFADLDDGKGKPGNKNRKPDRKP